MPRAAFSQIVNRSMCEVIDALAGDVVLHAAAGPRAAALRRRDAARTSPSRCSSASISGTYSSVFIAAPVLTHWKEREPVYRAPPRAGSRRSSAASCRPTRSRRGGGPVDVAPEEPRGRRADHRARGPERRSRASEFDEMVARPRIDDDASRRRAGATPRAAPDGRPRAARADGGTGPPSRPATPKPREPATASGDSAAKPKRRATAATGGPADGHARLGHDGPRHLALHDLPAGPLLGRDRRARSSARCSARSLFGLLVNGFTIPGQDDTAPADRARGDPRRRRSASGWLAGACARAALGAPRSGRPAPPATL